MPEGFEVASVELQDLGDDTLKPTKYDVANGKLKIPLEVKIRASWLIIKPKPAE